MSFNTEEYSLALDEFIVKMEAIRAFISPEINEAMARLCDVLRISRLEAYFYETPDHEFRDDGLKLVFRDRGEKDEEKLYTFRKATGGGNVTAYRLFGYKGSENWSKTELSKIEIFIKLLFSFNGRMKVMELAGKLMFTDTALDVKNHTYFMKNLSMYISDGTISKYGACYFNMRRFSIVNQNIGRPKGTLVLKRFIKQLESKLDKNECVCRIGGDNFAMLFKKEKLDIVINYLRGQQVVYDDETGERIKVSAYAGYYMIPEGCESTAEIMDCISNAVSMNRNNIMGDYVFFDDELVKKRNESKLVEILFPEAIANEEFIIYYQPKTCLDNYRLGGAEALCRWVRNGEMIPPLCFIPVLEQSKFICTLDFYMLERVCRDIRRWIDEGRNAVPISVNFSRRHLGDLDLLDRILTVIDKYEVPHHLIEIELTETTTDVDFKDLRKVVEGLSKAGVKTSVDDFGIGYSSLNLIRELPWTILKIDKSYLPARIDIHSKNYVMLKHLIAMAQDMGLECIAEGVETLEQVKLLKENHCYLAQGYFFDKPLPVEEFENRMIHIS